MKTLIILMAMVLFVPGMAFAGQWDGSIQGLSCAMHGKMCPTGMEDPYIAVEDNFVLQKGADNWYLLPNLEEGVMVRYLNQPVRVVGTKNPKYEAIDVEELHVQRDGEWKIVWSKEMEKEMITIKETWGM